MYLASPLFGSRKSFCLPQLLRVVYLLLTYLLSKIDYTIYIGETN